VSCRRKNARRLKKLRLFAGMPIGGDYRLLEPWAGQERGTRFDPREQKYILAALTKAPA
jgi:hypothetical protein